MLVDVMTEKIQFLDTKEALVGVDDNAMGTQSFKNSSQILEVLFWSGTSNENIIDVGVSRRDTTEDLVHESLECLCGVPEAERHLHKLEQAKWCCDSGLGYVFGGNWDLVICTDEVQFREDGGTLQ